MTLDLVSKAFNLRIKNLLERGLTIWNDCLTSTWDANWTGKYVYFPSGYYITFISNSLLSDIDECSQRKPCKTVTNSECKNTDGSYNCQCKDGFAKDGDNCKGTM